MEYTTITSQEQYEKYKKELRENANYWRVSDLDTKMKLNRIQKLCLDWEDKPKSNNIATVMKPYTKITTPEQYAEYKLVLSALMSLSCVTEEINADIKEVGGLIKAWETNKKEPKKQKAKP